MRIADLKARFGEPIAIFKPTSGQTFAGVFVCLLGAMVCYAVAFLNSGADLVNRICGGVLGCLAVGFAIWLYRKDKWRFVIFEKGVLQVHSDRTEELQWSQVKQVVRTKQQGFGERTARVTLHGAGRQIVVNPVNCGARSKLLETLCTTAESKGITVKIEWEDGD